MALWALIFLPSLRVLFIACTSEAASRRVWSCENAKRASNRDRAVSARVGGRVTLCARSPLAEQGPSTTLSLHRRSQRSTICKLFRQQSPMGSPSLTTEKMSLPSIDLRCFTAADGSEQADVESLKRNAMVEMDKACREWGFFQVINHGISEDMLEDVRKLVRSFFELSREEKQACQANDPFLQGFNSSKTLGAAEVNLFGEYVEFFVFHFLPDTLQDTRKWPPQLIQQLSLMREYIQGVRHLVEMIMDILSKQLGLSPSYLRQHFGGPHLVMRCNHYPPLRSADISHVASKGGVALSSHSDPGGITILLQDDVPGLEVEHNGNWVQVEASPSALVINLGDQVQVVSNGVYQSVNHRGMVPTSNKARLSVATFVNPALDSPIFPAKELTDELHPALYSSMTFGEYVNSFLQQGNKGKGYMQERMTRNLETEV